MSIESIADTIKPKSDQLNADDLIAGPITVTITSGRKVADPKQPLILEINGGHKPWKPCLSMRRIMAAIWGDDGRAWIGGCVTLFCDPTVVFGGKEQGGIRISHISGISKPKTVLLTATRGKRIPFTVNPTPQYDAAQFADNLPKWNAAIAAGRFSKDDVVYKAQQSGKLTEEQIKQIGI